MDKMAPMTVRVSTAPKNRLDKQAAAIRTGKEDVREGRIVSHDKAARWPLLGQEARATSAVVRLI